MNAPVHTRTEGPAHAIVPYRPSVPVVVAAVVAFLVAAGYLLFALLFVVLAWAMTDGMPSGSWWWVMVGLVPVLAWHCVGLGLAAFRGRRWLVGLVPGAVAGVVPVGLAAELFLVPGVLLLATTGAAAAVVRRRR